MVARAMLARAHSSHQPAWCGNTLVAEGRPVVTREPHDGHHVTPENSWWTGSACTRCTCITLQTFNSSKVARCSPQCDGQIDKLCSLPMLFHHHLYSLGWSWL